MTIQQIVEPDRIEPELLKLWEQLSKDKIRACLFNLIVVNRLSSRTDYIRKIVQTVSGKYPCRVLFITLDDQEKTPSLKTAVSVIGDQQVVCDYIDIKVSGSDIGKVSLLILPHLIPDLPVSLLWTEDPTENHSLFEPLVNLSHRVIFDSESASNLLSFAKTVLKLHEREIDTADLNWARTGGWRDLLASVFTSSQKLEKIQNIRLAYNEQKTDWFCHLKIQSMYLIGWLSSRLKWKFQQMKEPLHFLFENKTAEMQSAQWSKLSPGALISIDLATSDGFLYQCSRDKDAFHSVSIQISSEKECQIPYQYHLEKAATGRSLIKEITNRGTSPHYLETLQQILLIDKDIIC